MLFGQCLCVDKSLTIWNDNGTWLSPWHVALLCPQTQQDRWTSPLSEWHLCDFLRSLLCRAT